MFVKNSKIVKKLWIACIACPKKITFLKQIIFLYWFLYWYIEKEGCYLILGVQKSSEL